jgi:hypothetical protein
MDLSTSSRISNFSFKYSDDIWEERLFNDDEENNQVAIKKDNETALDHKFCGSMSDDFLMMDGIDIEDDFSGLLDINPGNAFDDLSETVKIEFPSANKDTPSKSRGKAGRSVSPPPKPKRRRSIDHRHMESPMSTSTVRSTRSSPLLLAAPELAGLEDQYKLALQHLALSMRRSELTRNEIIRQRQIAETKNKLAAVEAQNFSKADRFLSGSTSTLTVGLEQSRSMLKSYMAQMKNQMI